ncbi:hypothetical protein VRU48_10650 [Pedobacter sp. KR3-3]|uniref:Uncharacterized protein n=1 Tax=Pedobacter albus TaxID=3113905 RepID=A0ABU7I7W5_9SPHI|nr:hypothetical protein [Pedobacter sp. KR3-3]MEE1945565.1 hypothetical protein [Pedobacter sp. KR3-3]
MMKQEDLFKKLGLILNELNDQYQFLAQNPQQLNELELELFHANANFLADHVQIIKKINQAPQTPLAIPPANETIVETPQSAALTIDNDVQEAQQIEAVAFAEEITEAPVAEPEKEVQPAPEPELETIEQEVFKLDNEPSTFEFILNDHAEHEQFDFEEKSVDEIFDRPLSEEEERILAQKIKLSQQTAVAEAQEIELPETEEEPANEEEDEIGPEPFLVHKEEAKEEFPIVAADLDLQEAPVAETQVNTAEPVEDPSYKPTLNDILAGKTAANNINASANTIAIKDLKQAISLNDKLLYIKDLFNGYNLAYAEAIDLANKMQNFESADAFFQKNYAVKNNWAEKQATVDKFYALLNQRFKA